MDSKEWIVTRLARGLEPYVPRVAVYEWSVGERLGAMLLGEEQVNSN